MTTAAKRTPWWMSDREALLRLAQETSPAFVYSKRAIEAAIGHLRRLSSVDRIFFALKANHNADVLRTIEGVGVGFECVSLAELDYVQSLFPSIECDRLLFTPNFAPKSEYEAALSKGVHVTIDSPYPLEKWPQLFTERDVILRIDPGQGSGHHQYVRTAGKEAKFGADADDIEKIKRIANEIRCRIVGVHAHAGSGILDEKHWVDTSRQLYALKQHFPTINIINIGGGLGIPQSNFEQNPINFAALDAGLSKIRDVQKDGDVKIWQESGRFIISEAGVLITKVTQVRKKGTITFVGLDAGMNSLIRPSLYGARHEIHNLTKYDRTPQVETTVVGPICESADVFGKYQLPADTEEDDVILIESCGAYGRVMSSTYNMREPATELFIN